MHTVYTTDFPISLLGSFTKSKNGRVGPYSLDAFSSPGRGSLDSDLFESNKVTYWDMAGWLISSAPACD